MKKGSMYVVALLLAITFLLYTTKVYAQRNMLTVHKPFADFTLPSLDGDEVSISDFAGKKNVVLVTFRGWVGYWWPICRSQLGELNDAIDRFRDHDAELLFIIPDNKEESEKFLEAAGVEDRKFTLLLDPEFRVIKRLLLFKENEIKGEAEPATFIIDKEGILRFKFIPQHYSERPPLDHIFEMLKIAGMKR